MSHQPIATAVHLFPHGAEPEASAFAQSVAKDFLAEPFYDGRCWWFVVHELTQDQAEERVRRVMTGLDPQWESKHVRIVPLTTN